MNVAVKFYKDVLNAPDGMPPEWPAEVRELYESTELPRTGGPWKLMTIEQYVAHCAEHEEKYRRYEAIYKPDLYGASGKKIPFWLVLWNRWKFD